MGLECASKAGSGVLLAQSDIASAKSGCRPPMFALPAAETTERAVLRAVPIIPIVSTESRIEGTVTADATWAVSFLLVGQAIVV